MTCAKLEPWIAAYADGELEARRGEIVEEHLAQCAACAALLAEFTALAASMRDGLEVVEAPATLHTRVMAALPEPECVGPKRAGVAPPRGWFAFFGLAPAAMLGIWLLTAPPAPIPGRGTQGARNEHAALETPPLEREARSTEPQHPPNHAPVAASQKSRTERGARSTERKQSGKPGDAKVKSPQRPKVTPETDASPEPNSLRRLKQLRPRRYHEFLVETPRRRWPGRRGGRGILVADDAWKRPIGPQAARSRSARTVEPDAAIHEAPPRATPRTADFVPRITVVDYVLPQVQPQPGPSEFLNGADAHAAEGVQVTQAVFES